MKPHLCRRAPLITVTAMLAACAGPATTAPAQTATPSKAAPVTSPPPRSSPTPPLTACPPPRDINALTVVHHFSVSPDDIAVAPDGRLLVTALSADVLITLDPSGTVVSTQHVAGGPEGVAAGATSLYVAQQLVNAVVQLPPASRTVATLPTRAGNLGVDGIALDATRNRLLVPDSATGDLYAVPLGGGAKALLATDFGRPVAATTDAAGDVFVASENSPGLSVISAAGARTTLGHFTDLDEVVDFAGLLYVTELDRHDVVAVDPATGASAVLATNLPAPQGLAVTAAGALEIVDATTNTLYSTPGCGGA